MTFEMSDRITGPMTDVQENDSYQRELYSKSPLTKLTISLSGQSEDSWALCYLSNVFLALGFYSFPGVLTLGLIVKTSRPSSVHLLLDNKPSKTFDKNPAPI